MRLWRAALVLWGIAVVALCMRAWLQPTRNSVYPIFARAGQCWNERADLYRRPPEGSGSDRFRYGPMAACVFAPLACLPLGPAGIAWRLLNVAVFVSGFAFFVRTHARTADAPASGWCALLLLLLALPSLNNAQVNPLASGFLLFALAAAKRQWWTTAALCVSVPALLKIYPLSAALLLVLLHPKQLAGRLALCLAAGLLLPFLLHDAAYVAEQYGSWWREIACDERLERSGSAGYRDLRLLLGLLGVPLTPAQYFMVELAGAVASAGLIGAGRRRGWSQARLARAVLDLSCLWMTLLGPATESCTYTLLAPTLALAGREAAQPGRSLWTRCGLLVIVALFLGSLTATALPGGKAVAYFLNPLAALILGCERLIALTRPAPAASSPEVMVRRIRIEREAERARWTQCVEQT